MSQRWRVDKGDVRVDLDVGEQWGASLAVLVAAIHHPRVLATMQPDADPADVARQTLAELAELEAAAASADGAAEDEDVGEGRWSATVRRDGEELVFSPGVEIASLAWCLHIFATAVLDPASHEANVARGATAYAASAWSREIGEASGALGKTRPRRHPAGDVTPRAPRASRGARARGRP